LEKGNIIGDEDMLNKEKYYQTTVKCTSMQGLVWCMRREDFLRLENQSSAWTAISFNAK